MSPPLDSFRLQAFLAVVRERGFSRAARALGKSQSSISQAVAQLEEDVGEALFLRDGRSTHLTDAGRLLQAHAQRIFGEMEAARAGLAASREVRGGDLVVAASDTLALYLLPPVFAAFRQRHPGVDLRLQNRPSPATALEVSERRAHVGVVSLPLPPGAGDRVAVSRLCAHEDVAICAPGHPLAGRRRISVGALATHPLLLLDRTTGSRAALDAAFTRAGVQARVVMEMSSVEVLKRLCQLDFGVSVVPAMAVAREVAARTLAAIPLHGLGASRDVGLVTPVPGPPSRAAVAFAEIARAVLERETPRKPVAY